MDVTGAHKENVVETFFNLFDVINEKSLFVGLAVSVFSFMILYFDSSTTRISRRTHVQYTRNYLSLNYFVAISSGFLVALLIYNEN